LASLSLFWGGRGGTVEGVLVAGSATLAVSLLPPLAWESVRALRQHNPGGARA